MPRTRSADREDALARYRAKRDFAKTPEPGPEVESGAGGHRFVVQKHAARRLHYDFRLELDGVLKSWAVTRGPSLDPADRRLAVRTEDHPLAYGGFEGVIPAGQYGGGTVVLWDQGTWEPLSPPEQGLAKGHLHFRLSGARMHGEWSLVRMNKPDEKRENWLLIKGDDDEARPGKGASLVDKAQTSVASKRAMDRIAADRDAVWSSSRADPPDTPKSEPVRRGKAPGSPPRFVPPQLATLVDHPPAGDQWLHEIKYDGYRIACRIAGGKATMLTRGGLDWTPKFAALAERAAGLPVDTALIDGEVVVLNETGVSSFSALQQALSEGDDNALTYFAFDLLDLDGKELTARPLEERKAALRALFADVPPDGRLRYSEHYAGRGADFFRNACRMALEGTVSKRRDRPYVSGRGRDWQKSKCVLRQEFVIGGFLPSAAAGRALGSLAVGYRRDGKLVYAGRVGTGFSGAVADDLRQKLDARTVKTPPFESVPRAAARGVRWVKPDLVCEVAFAAWTADGMIRHAAFQGLREDKEAEEVTLEQPAKADDTDKTAATPRRARPQPKSGPVEMAGIHLTHPDKVLYPDIGLTKRDLADYYGQVAVLMLPHVANRPLSVVRCPDGQAGECFFQRHYGPGLPAAIQRAPVEGTKGGETYLKIGSAAGLVGLVQIGVLEIHPWGARADAPDKPDRVIFDFDPGPEVEWQAVVAAAEECRDRLDALKLKSFVKTTGGKGLHVVVPVARRYGWPLVKGFAKALAGQMAADAPDRFTVTMAKSARTGRIFIDYLRNDLTATAVAPYSSRARPGAPVATPLHWRELPGIPGGGHFTVRTLPQRLTRGFEDPWHDMPHLNQTLSAAARAALRLKD
jgi:bifunctional non-homologous end joining protein LigD